MATRTYLFTRAQLLTTAITFIALVAMVLPRAVEAATGSAVTIVDPSASSRKARVTAEGRLHTTTCDADSCAAVDSGKVRVHDGSGAMTVDGSVQVRPTTPFAMMDEAYADNTFDYCSLLIDVPAGKRLVIESLDVNATPPATQKVWRASFSLITNGNATHHGILLDLQGSRGEYAHYVSSVVGPFYADGGVPVGATISRDANTGVMLCSLNVSGYLV